MKFGQLIEHNYEKYLCSKIMQKFKVISKFMTSQVGQQIITIHILSNISRSEDNDAMNFVLEKSYSKCGTETSP